MFEDGIKAEFYKWGPKSVFFFVFFPTMSLCPFVSVHVESYSLGMKGQSHKIGETNTTEQRNRKLDMQNFKGVMRVQNS